MEVIFYSGCRDFYLVLRLIPDLCMKAAECVRMVQSLLDSTKGGFEREQSYIFEVWRPIESFNVQTTEEKKLSELTTEKDLLVKEADEHSVSLKIVRESLEGTRKKLDLVVGRMNELNKKKSQACFMLAQLTKQLKFHKEQARDIKLKMCKNKTQASLSKVSFNVEENRERWVSVLLSDMTPKEVVSLPNLRALSSTDVTEQMKLEHKAVCLDIEEIHKCLNSNQNTLKNIENDLKSVLKEKINLEKVEKLLAKDESMLKSRAMDIEMTNRVLTSFICRTEKNIKKAADRLPPVD